MRTETWKDIVGYEGLYTISSSGIIKNKKGNELAQHIRNGYKYVLLYKLGYPRKKYNIHRLMALTFLTNPESIPQVNHKDCNRLNNNIDNLEWCDSFHNMRHARKMGRMVNSHGGTRVINPKTGEKFSSILSLSANLGLPHATVYGKIYRNKINDTGFYPEGHLELSFGI